jgi:hypothetical protein
MSGFTKGKDEEYKTLLDQDPNLRRWFLNNTKGSIIVAEVYLRRLGFFCLQNNISPGDYAKLPKRKMEEIAFDYSYEYNQKLNGSAKHHSDGQIVQIIGLCKAAENFKSHGIIIN